MAYFNLLSEAGANNSAMTYIIFPLLLVVLIGGFAWSNYTNKKRQKNALEMINKLMPGDKVKTIGGICGTIVEIDTQENTFVLETGAEGLKSYIKFDRQAIYQTESMQKPAEELPETDVQEQPEAAGETQNDEETKAED